MNFPAELKYTKDHEWIRVDGDEAIIGITEFAQRELGDIVFIEIPTVEEEVVANEVFGTIEAVKTVSDLFMPITGTVIAVNEQLEGAPELVNTDPYGEGWIVKIRISEPSQLESLLKADNYQELVGA